MKHNVVQLYSKSFIEAIYYYGLDRDFKVNSCLSRYYSWYDRHFCRSFYKKLFRVEPPISVAYSCSM